MAKIGRRGKLLHHISWFRVGRKLEKGCGVQATHCSGRRKKSVSRCVGLAAIEPEGGFVQISLQMIFFERVLMCTHQPSLNDRWQRGVCQARPR